NATGKREGTNNSFAGVDVTYRWKPLQQGLYRGFIGRFEGTANRGLCTACTLKGFYASGDYQFAQRWFTGVRIDEAPRPFSGSIFIPVDHSVSATLTFWPSEFSLLRAQLRRTHYGDAIHPKP